jgi:hypothetical protein
MWKKPETKLPVAHALMRAASALVPTQFSSREQVRLRRRKASRRHRQADCQSAAGYHPAPRVAFVALIFLALTGVACRGKHNRVTVQNEEDNEPRMLSTVRTNDPRASAQLMSGFYGIEGNAWRWTAGRFSVLLKTPLAAVQRGGTVNLAFTIPEVITQKLGNIAVTASINGTVLNTGEFKAQGAYVFTADVPASLLGSESVKVDFALDKSLPPGVDQRELGIIATSIGISSK